MAKQKDTTDWKKIALALAQRVNFAVTSCTCPGGTVIGKMADDKSHFEVQHWHDYMMEPMRMIPGVNVDEELFLTLRMPANERKAAQKAIKDERSKKHDSESVKPRRNSILR